LSDRPSLQELLEVQQQFDLPSSALVEKDWHVVKALAAIVAADTGSFQLVFGGGTALSRAYRLIRRMSEDIDLRITAPIAPTRSALRNLRDSITDALRDAGFKFDPNNSAHRNSMYDNRYTIYRLPYEPISEGKGALRPEIQIETAVFPSRRPPVHRPVISFIAEGYSRPAEVAAIACTAISEIAAEKFVALTRRAGAELAGVREKHDPTLVRHLYDLHVIRDHYDTADMTGLACEIMLVDAETRAANFPAYRDNPVAETIKAIKGIAASAGFAADYANFRRDMVYGEGPDFDTAVATLKRLAQRLQEA
jgi:predicted nucleotidyltransferase component of viral defense system